MKKGLKKKVVSKRSVERIDAEKKSASSGRNGAGKKKLAIVGTGIAGMGIAHFLKDRYDLTVYEKGNYVGGHSNTVEADEDGTAIPIDTGFIVFNHVTYPNLKRLFDELDVPTKKSSMSFSVQNVPKGLEFCGSGIGGLFAQKRNYINPKFLRLLYNINRFNGEAPGILENSKYLNLTLREYVDEAGYHPDLLSDYLIPMSSAVWSTPDEKMAEFPAYSLVRFFLNHGFLGLNTQHQWYTVDGGSREYVKRLIAPIRDRIRLNAQVRAVRQEDGKVRVVLKNGESSLFDKVVLATHADVSLKLLKKPTALQKELLREFEYQKNVATLHTDDSSMPKTKSCWSSWNYRIEEIRGEKVSSTVYWMNSLQNVSRRRNYFLSINDPGTADRRKIIQEIEYDHPLFTLGSLRAQSRLQELNAEGNIHFCGAYFRNGFHEDGLWSAQVLAQSLLGKGVRN
ncbi:NADP transhydrogenase subunit alpha [Leptospira ellisii]|uniref:NADP transhydrogenase subunit alpha n=1 Tax=Leptospira ellisii TaxID=2023197 RepID=A0A2N0BN13_9LEPT|nr:NADP transhydrogenase subunit alpha [Leptospira ellisii]PKA05385.1 NADP transhydrogenase subunit alpha [Leptospira ellisii]